MSDLHRAVQDEIASFTPPVAPPFAAITARRRARDRRRLAAGGVALGAVALLAVAVPSLSGTGGDRLTAGRPPAPYAAATDIGLVWTGATVCLGTDRDCRSLRADQAQQLDAVLGTAVPAPPDTGYCRAAGTTYTVLFQHPRARTVPITVRTLCGPMEQGGDKYLLDRAGQDQVEAFYQAAGSPANEDPLVAGRVNGLAIGDSVMVVLAAPCGVPPLLVDGVPYLPTGWSAPGTSPPGWGATQQGRLRRITDDSLIFVASDNTVRLQFFAAPGRSLAGC